MAVLLLALGIAFKMVAPYILALITGGILALLANPLYGYLCRKHMGSKTAATITIVLVILLVVIPTLPPRCVFPLL
jgi:predicted PurR-regulated permease PerM